MSLIKKERKKERLGPFNFYLTSSEEDHTLFERIETLRHRDRWTFTRFMKEACLEYVTRHLPGNPTIPLTHWTENEPLSIAAKEKLSWGMECDQCQGSGESEIGSKCRVCSGLGRIQNVQ